MFDKTMIVKHHLSLEKFNKEKEISNKGQNFTYPFLVILL